MRKTLAPLPFIFSLLAIGLLWPLTLASVQAQEATPGYDPLVEPTLPPNPSELDTGGNLYWHWCMTCHGDFGQGLTDEWRSVWEEDHQNCWGRGCHAGRPGDTGFPIPTVVPAIANGLPGFASLDELYAYLKDTHPPQHPGLLEDKEYHAIAVYVFTMNQRRLDEPGATPTPPTSATPAPTFTLFAASITSTPVPMPVAQNSDTPWFLLALGAALLGALFVLIQVRSRRR